MNNTTEDNYEKEWHGRGSPQYDEKIHIPLLCEIFSKGGSTADYCASADISPRTFHNWVKKYPDFKYRYKIELTKGLAIWEKKPIELAKEGISINPSYWATIMSHRYNYYKKSIKYKKTDTTESKLKSAWQSLRKGSITPQEYNQIASGLTSESKIIELELKRRELDQIKESSVPKEVSDEALRAYMLVKEGKGKVVEIGS